MPKIITRCLLLSVLLLPATFVHADHRPPPARAAHRSAMIVSSHNALHEGNFERHKGHLPWPVEAGTIAMGFGLQNLPNKIRYFNKSLTIAAKAASAIRVVFIGTVTGITKVEDTKVVIVRHGRYYTAYSNLSSTTVAIGDKVESGQEIGRLAEKSRGMGELEFMIMTDTFNNLNPRRWLR